MYQTILVPLDGSERAEAIMPHVESLAHLYQARIILLRVFELSHRINQPRAEDEAFDALPQVSPQEMQAQVEEAYVYLGQCAKQLQSHAITATYRVAYGPVAATIMRIAQEDDVDLIAMASHGCSGLQGVYYGSVAAGVLQRVDRPLLIVRANNTHE